MDYYPEDLLVGVFPLVFCVNAILSESEQDATSTGQHHRTLFDRFLDAIAALSLMDESTEETTKDGIKTVSLFRPDEDEDESSSDDDEDLYFGGARQHNARRSFFGVRPHRQQAATASLTGSGSNNNPSYAKALTTGAPGFFQRARLEAVSTRHGFPPSKDGDGTHNLAQALSKVWKQHVQAAQNARQSQSSTDGPSSHDSSTSDNERWTRLFQEHPLQGILPAGWLEKHVHALPSVLLVIVTVCGNQQQQDAQDRYLYETVQHLQETCFVPKRACQIHVIGLLNNDVTDAQAQEWSRAVQFYHPPDQLPPSQPPFEVTLLRSEADLTCNDTGMPASLELKRLHRTVRDASLAYYLGQARRTKEKLSILASTTTSSLRRSGSRGEPPLPLLPWVIRYCFKIAIYYEFQWKHEKSLRYMAEAYRHLTRYYQYLLQQQQSPGAKDDEDRPSLSTIVAPSSPSPTPRRSPSSQRKKATSHADSEESGVEVSLDDDAPSFLNNGEAFWQDVVPDTPEDMLRQCRAVAEWLNLKLLLAGFGSHTSAGLLAASEQWRQHVGVFCSLATGTGGGSDWSTWCYRARQWQVMSQVLERHPPKALGDLGNNPQYDEVLLRCSPWRTYQSTAEALLRLARAVEQATGASLDSPSDPHRLGVQAETSASSDPMRARYVGGADNSFEALGLQLQEEAKVQHREKALDLILRAIASYEHEMEKEKRGFYAEDKDSEQASCRTGARLYYFAGGILLGMNRHEEAASLLTKAAKFAQGWQELEIAIRRLLIECYGKHIPSQTEANESSQALASMILDSYFNAEMSSSDLRKALGHFAAMTGGESLKWYHDTVDEEDASLPFSFTVTFPATTHATAGDNVKGSVLIKSNLDYAVHVNSIVLVSSAGELAISKNDLMSAQNASEGGEGSIIIQAKTEIVLSTSLDLPKNLSSIATDESGNGGEVQGVAGKGSFAKNARPRSAGLTSAGGARLVSEQDLSPGNASNQGWNMRFLGGKSLHCDGLKLVFYPVQIEKAAGGAEKVTLIELTIEKKKRRTAANIRRTPFEEDNYLSSAWSRPQHLPFSRGPRCLRVLDPRSELVVTNITEPVTDGKALEGTVNRILLKLQSGNMEHCRDLKVRVSCFTVLMTSTGTTKRLVAPEDLTEETEDSVDAKNPVYRTPVLVTASPESPAITTADYGYDLPSGWTLAGSGQGYDGPTVPSMKYGESTYVQLNLFRPAASLQNASKPDDVELDESSLCKTDFYVTVTYRQERPSSQKASRGRRVTSLRQRPVMKAAKATESGANAEDGSGSLPAKSVVNAAEEPADEVSLEYSGSVIWSQPFTAVFRPDSRRSFPSGSRHPSNSIDATGNEGSNEEIAMIDGETLCTNCSLEVDQSMKELRTEIVAVHFQAESDSHSPLNLTLQSGEDPVDETLLYKASPTDPRRILSADSKFSVAYTVVGDLKNDFRKGGVSSNLGAVLVDWLPLALPLPSSIEGDHASLDGITSHGPLVPAGPSTIRFTGPPCYMECAPFEASLRSVPAKPTVAQAFEVNYDIRNRTNLHQTVTVEIPGISTVGEGTEVFDGLLVSGMMNGTLFLAPDEAQTLSYTVLCMRSGKVMFPALRVSSERYRSWIINGFSASGLPVFFFP